MLKAKVKYSFHIKDATLFYSDYDNSLNFETEDSLELDDGVSISGVEPETIFLLARNTLACREPVQDKMKVRDFHVKCAREIVASLNAFIKKHDDSEESE